MVRHVVASLGFAVWLMALAQPALAINRQTFGSSIDLTGNAAASAGRTDCQLRQIKGSSYDMGFAPNVRSFANLHLQCGLH